MCRAKENNFAYISSAVNVVNKINNTNKRKQTKWIEERTRKNKGACQRDRTPDLVDGRQTFAPLDHSLARWKRGRVFDLTDMLFFSLVLSSIHFCLFSFICFALFYLQLPQYFFTRNNFPLHDTQPNRTNFSFSNSRALVNQVVDHWSRAMASFWDLKIICAPTIISKTVL